MSDAEKRDHWADLASTMGLSPVQEPPKPKASAQEPEFVPPVSAELGTEDAPLADGPAAEPAAVREVASPVSRPAPTPPRPAAPRKPANWDLLASELGIAPAPPPVRREEPIAAPVPVSTPAPIPVAIAAEDDVDEAEPEEPTFSEVFRSEATELSDPLFLDALPEAEAEGGEPGETPAKPESDEEGERRSRRRRRRRRGRRSDEPREASPDSAAPVAESGGFGSGLIDEETGEAEPAAPAESSSETEEKGRRERRGRGRRGRRRERRPADQDATTRKEPLSAEGAADDDIEDLSAILGDEDGGDDDGEVSSKWAHRAIPTWEDTISVIVTRNIESRAKNPEGQGPHGRGGRGGHRRDRGPRR